MQSQSELAYLGSFITVDKKSDFPIENLPYGVFSHQASGREALAVAIGDFVLDLSFLEKKGLLKEKKHLFQEPSLNLFMQQGREVWQSVRRQLTSLLSLKNAALRDNPELREHAFLPQKEVVMKLPFHIGDYTDFYASKEHASNVGSMFRDKNNPLLPNWLHLPVGYHGRSSSIVASKTAIRRPLGQVKAVAKEALPELRPSSRCDFELELAACIGTGNPLGSSISVDEASSHIFGLLLMNDWSARDIQKWEYVPLGPFVSKSFATSISPWVVPLEALAPFLTKGPKQEPKPLAYLRSSADRRQHYDINFAVDLKASSLREGKTICRTNSKYLYWSFAQKIAHHTITGCNLRTGDLLASGTISGPSPGSYGSLLELAWGGEKPLSLAEGESRTFLEDYDEVKMRGWCEKDGLRIGFGSVEGQILPARI